MEQALFRLHVRVVTLSRRLLSRRAQQCLELVILTFAIAALITLYCVHKAYVSSTGSTCLVEALAEGRVPKDYQLLNISIYDESKLFKTLAQSFLSNVAPPRQASCERPISTTKRLYLFSLDKGYLMLSSKAIKTHGIVTLNVSLGCADSCFGSPFYVLLLYYVVGYDTVVKNWVMKYFGGKGYLYNVLSEEIFDLSIAADFVKKTGNAGSTGIVKGYVGDSLWGYIDSLNHYIAFKVGVLLTALFLFFTTTTLVSFTLRITQERMIRFTFLLQQAISRRLPIVALVVTHVVETLVFVPLYLGTTFFMYEFFFDHMLAFLVIGVVWLAEIFSLMSLRTLVSIRYFPKLFLFYFSMFNIYFFSFPYGFSYLALASTVLFLLHSMLFLMHRYEFPALENGLISAHCPRAVSPVVTTASQAGPAPLPQEALDASLFASSMDRDITGTRIATLQQSSPHNELSISRHQQSPQTGFSGGNRARRASRNYSSARAAMAGGGGGASMTFPDISTENAHGSSSPFRSPHYLQVMGSNPLRESTSSSFFTMAEDDDLVLASSGSASATERIHFVEECSRHVQLSRQIQQQEMESVWSS